MTLIWEKIELLPVGLGVIFGTINALEFCVSRRGGFAWFLGFQAEITLCAVLSGAYVGASSFSGSLPE
jgi:hypothetical protein